LFSGNYMQPPPCGGGPSIAGHMMGQNALLPAPDLSDFSD
jgi:hypothetical protein